MCMRAARRRPTATAPSFGSPRVCRSRVLRRPRPCLLRCHRATSRGRLSPRMSDSSRNAPAACERRSSRWTRPISRVIGGSGVRTHAPRRRASAASVAGKSAAPAPASTSGIVASLAAVSTAMHGSTPASARACSSRIRVEVPVGGTTSGVLESSRTGNGVEFDRRCGGKTSRSSCWPEDVGVEALDRSR